MRIKKIGVGILGCTGIVGQQYAVLLQDHPFFELSFLAASKDSSGKSYGEALLEKKRALESLPRSFLQMPVEIIDAVDQACQRCSFVFSAMSGEVAGTYEKLYASAGLPVISNASSHRMDPDVPLLIPEINPNHLEILPEQQKKRGWKKGFIVTKPNCSLQSYLIPLFPLHRLFGLKKVLLTTLQAVSGAGYPGVSCWDMMDNIIPYIPDEEEKTEREPLKILGAVHREQGVILPKEGIAIGAHCNRVSVIDGHTACVSVQFERRPKREEILETWRGFKGLPQELSLPSAPEQVIVYRNENNRPQPRLDREEGKGMAVTVGRLRECPVFDFRFVALSHNTLRGAAKGGILNAELLYAQGYLS